MPKYPTYPVLLDEVLQLDLSKLRKWGYLKPNQFRTGTVTWSRNGHETSSMSINVWTFSNPYIELNYKFNGKSRKYKVNLVAVSSNLGVGEILYCLCPQTKKRCRKLYLVNGYFLHREAFNGCMYECQTRSKTWREWEKAFGSDFEIERNYEQIYQKHFKKYYAGKPTKRYLQIIKKIQQAQTTCHLLNEGSLLL